MAATSTYHNFGELMPHTRAHVQGFLGHERWRGHWRETESPCHKDPRFPMDSPWQMGGGLPNVTTTKISEGGVHGSKEN